MTSVHYGIGASTRAFRAAGVLALLLASGSASAVPVTTWSYSLSQLQHGIYNNDGQPDVQDYVGITPNVAAEGLANGLKLFSPGDGSHTFGLTGESYIGTPPQPVNGEGLAMRGNRFTNYGGGTIDGPSWQDPNDVVRTSFQFGVDFSGGTLAIYEIRTSFLLTDSQGGFVAGVGSGTGLGQFEPGGYGFGFAFEDRFNGPIPTAVNIFWGVEIYFDWTGQDVDDTLNFTVPHDSIDIQAMTVPAPAGAGLLAIASLAAIRRRR